LIGIDYTAAYEQGAGIGRLVRDLIHTLGQEDSQTTYKLFVAGATSPRLPALPNTNFIWKPTRITPLWFARIWYRARIYYPIELFTGQLQLYHATDFTLPPTLPSTKTILTVHDLSYVQAPETTHPILKRYLDQVVPWSVKRANHIIVDSTATRQDLIDIYNTPPEKVSVLLSGVDPRFQRSSNTHIDLVRQKYNIGDNRYIFSIGTVQPRKNYGRIVEALHHLGNEFSDVKLVIAGGKGWLDSPIYETVERLDMHERVMFAGFVDDEDVPALYSGATITAYPSLYEGFGFPILESMACGTPVVTSNVSSMPEVAGNAALLVDPYDVNALSNSLRELLTKPVLRERLITLGYAQAEKFTWQQAAQNLLSIYERVLAQG